MSGSTVNITHSQSSAIQIPSNQYGCCDAMITFVALAALGAFVVGILSILASHNIVTGLGAMNALGWRLGTVCACVGFAFLIGSIILLSKRCCSSEKAVLATTSPSNPLRIVKKVSLPQPTPISPKSSTPPISPPPHAVDDTGSKTQPVVITPSTPPRSNTPPISSPPLAVDDTGSKTQPVVITPPKTPPPAATPTTLLQTTSLQSPAVVPNTSPPIPKRRVAAYLPVMDRTATWLLPYQVGGTLSHQQVDQIYYAVVSELKITDVREPPVLWVSGDYRDPQDIEILKAQIKLWLASDASILTLTLSQIATFPLVLYRTLGERLMRMEQSGPDVSPVMDESHLGDLNQLTLLEFRSLSGETIRKLSNLNKKLLGILKATQITEILQSGEIEEEVLQTLLPAAGLLDRFCLYTQQRLAAIPEAVLWPHITKFTERQAHCLPLSYFRSPSFPWEVITHAHDFLPTETPFLEKTKDILKIAELPWPHLIRLPGIGKSLRVVDDLTDFASASFPWESFADYPNEVRSVFPTASYEIEKTHMLLRQLESNSLKILLSKQIWKVNELFPSASYELPKTAPFLQTLHTDVIRIIAPQLAEEALPGFTPAQRTDAQFPWADFIHKGKVGEVLRTLGDLSVFASDTFPWESFADNPDEVRKLFPTPSYEIEKTYKWLRQLKPESFKLLLSKSIWDVNKLFPSASYEIARTGQFLQQLNFDLIRIIAPQLAVEALPGFSPAQCTDGQFPWADFIHKNKVGEVLRNLGDLSAFASDAFPWEGFASNPKAVRDLFPTESYNIQKTYDHLRQLKPKAFNLLLSQKCWRTEDLFSKASFNIAKTSAFLQNLKDDVIRHLFSEKILDQTYVDLLSPQQKSLVS